MDKKIIIFSGAGLSAESGISTFRGENGVWENHNLDEVCNIKTWVENKEKVFNFYNERRRQLKTVVPSAGHILIADLQKKYGVENVINITQNVDDLLERAGVENVLHVHGSLKETICLDCGNVKNIGYDDMEIDCECDQCQSKNIKPNIIFFGEDSLAYHLMKRIFRNVKSEDIFIVIGTSGNVVPINLHMQTTYGYKILNILEPSRYIDDSLFQKVLYGKISDVEKEIKSTIIKHFNY